MFWNPCARWVGMESSAADMQNSREVPQKIKKRGLQTAQW